MVSVTYEEQRARLGTYFDRTAVEAWSRLTTDAPVGRIRATVRAGRDQMRQKLLSWLPEDLSGQRVLDAGCGTGAFAVEAARRGASVVGIDLSPTLIELARNRLPADLGTGSVEFRVGDMLSPDDRRFDHTVAMDSLIHYRTVDCVRALAGLAARTDDRVLFTFAPRTKLLSVMHAVGRLFPRGDRAPAIEPVGEVRLHREIGEQLGAVTPHRTERVTSGFYVSQAMELRCG